MFRVNAQSGVPVYLQLVEQVRHAIEVAALRPGDQLPAIRKVAEDLVVNVNTVAKAYRELEVAGVVEKRRTAGTYVSDAGSPLARRERLKILTERIDALLAEARQLGIRTDDVIDLLPDRPAGDLRALRLERRGLGFDQPLERGELRVDPVERSGGRGHDAILAELRISSGCRRARGRRRSAARSPSGAGTAPTCRRGRPPCSF